MVPPHPRPNPAAHARPQTWWDAEGNEHPCYVLRFWFEWATETALWPAKNVARERFGIGPIMPEELPLLEATQCQVSALATWHDSALNGEYPPDPGPWRQRALGQATAVHPRYTTRPTLGCCVLPTTMRPCTALLCPAPTFPLLS